MTSEKERIFIEEHVDERLDKMLVHHFSEYSRTYFHYLIEQGLVLVNGEIVKKRTKLKLGDEIEIAFALTPELTLEPESIPLDILYEDEELLAINKPAGLVVHPGVGNWSGTFVNALLFHCRQIEKGDSLRPGIVHRLDKDTTGVLIAAKTERMQQKLVELFAARKMKKTYRAICIGKPGNRLIDNPIARHPERRKEMAIVEGGKEAKTEVKTLFFDGKFSVLHLFPFTGRTHQLRVHLTSINTPILGDSLYGNLQWNKKYEVQKQLLHAESLSFAHPFTGSQLEIYAPAPLFFQEWEAQIKSRLP